MCETYLLHLFNVCVSIRRHRSLAFLHGIYVCRPHCAKFVIGFDSTLVSFKLLPSSFIDVRLPACLLFQPWQTNNFIPAEALGALLLLRSTNLCAKLCAVLKSQHEFVVSISLRSKLRSGLRCEDCSSTPAVPDPRSTRNRKNCDECNHRLPSGQILRTRVGTFYKATHAVWQPGCKLYVHCTGPGFPRCKCS